MLAQEQIDLIESPTPRESISQREGRGGRTFDYVDISWVIQKLNRVFNYGWSAEVAGPVQWLDASDEVIVPVRLRTFVAGPNGIHEIVKEQFGKDDVIKNRDGRVVSAGDNLKAAFSDGLKKCASLFGIAGDVYSGETTQQRLQQGRTQRAAPRQPPAATQPQTVVEEPVQPALEAVQQPTPSATEPAPGPLPQTAPPTSVRSTTAPKAAESKRRGRPPRNQPSVTVADETAEQTEPASEEIDNTAGEQVAPTPPARVVSVRQFTVPTTVNAAHTLLFKIAAEDLGIPNERARPYLVERGYTVRDFPDKFNEMLEHLKELAQAA